MENSALEVPHESFLGPSPKRLMMKTSGITTPRDALKQGRSMTPSSSGSNRSLNRAQRSMMTGLQEAVQEYKDAPPANTLPQPLFTSSSSVCLEEGMRQMLEVVMAMSETSFADQGSQEDLVRNKWKDLKRGRTATTNYPWTEYWFNGEVCFGHPDVPTL